MSKLSTESPPFNPHGAAGGLLMGTPGGYRGLSRSRSTSPHPHHRSHSPYGGSTAAVVPAENAQSNALPKFTFDYEG